MSLVGTRPPTVDEWEQYELHHRSRMSTKPGITGIEKYLAERELDLTATLDAKEAYSDADFVVIAAPTNYDSKKNFFDTSAVEAVIKLVILIFTMK